MKLPPEEWNGARRSKPPETLTARSDEKKESSALMTRPVGFPQEVRHVHQAWKPDTTACRNKLHTSHAFLAAFKISSKTSGTAPCDCFRRSVGAARL